MEYGVFMYKEDKDGEGETEVPSKTPCAYEVAWSQPRRCCKASRCHLKQNK